MSLCPKRNSILVSISYKIKHFLEKQQKRSRLKVTGYGSQVRECLVYCFIMNVSLCIGKISNKFLFLVIKLTLFNTLVEAQVPTIK